MELIAALVRVQQNAIATCCQQSRLQKVYQDRLHVLLLFAAVLKALRDHIGHSHSSRLAWVQQCQLGVLSTLAILCSALQHNFNRPSQCIAVRHISGGALQLIMAQCQISTTEPSLACIFLTSGILVYALEWVYYNMKDKLARQQCSSFMNMTLDTSWINT